MDMKIITSQSELNSVAPLATPWPHRAFDDFRLRTATPEQNETEDARWPREIWGEPHNGWPNYHTWCVYFSIAGEDAIYRHWLQRAAAVSAEAIDAGKRNRPHNGRGDRRGSALLFEDLCNAFYGTPLVSKFGVHSELLMLALGQVNWMSLAVALHEESANDTLDAANPRVPNSLTDGRTRFSTGGVTASPGVLKILSQKQLVDAVIRHQRGDWGHVDEELRQANEALIHAEGRLVSAYENQDQVEFWIITDYDRAATNVLLPSEY